jgi:hypothetical protein
MYLGQTSYFRVDKYTENRHGCAAANLVFELRIPSGILLPGVRIEELLQLLRDLFKIVQVLLSSRGALVVLLGLHLLLIIQALDLVLSGISAIG